jgi:hypothetical protein
MRALSFQEVRRAVQALSSVYVERRDRIRQGAVLDGAGKRVAFATYFAPLHFLLIREIVRALKANTAHFSTLLDLGCGTGVAAAAWATEVNPGPAIIGIDKSSWAVQEARWTYSAFGLSASVQTVDINTFKLPERTATVAAFIINELADEARERWRRQLLLAAKRGVPIFVIEPISKRVVSWWDDWAADWIASGGRNDEWRFTVELPERIALMDKAAGLDHRELTGRSLWMPGN